MARPSKITTFTLPEGVPSWAQAAGLAVSLLGKCKLDTWAELEEQIEDPGVAKALSLMYLTPEQIHLLRTEPSVYDVGARPPRRTLAWCDTCREPILLVATAPSACTMTRGCPGSYVKLSVAAVVGVDRDALLAGGAPQDLSTTPEPETETAAGTPEVDESDLDAEHFVDDFDPDDLEEFDFDGSSAA